MPPRISEAARFKNRALAFNDIVNLRLIIEFNHRVDKGSCQVDVLRVKRPAWNYGFGLDDSSSSCHGHQRIEVSGSR